MDDQRTGETVGGMSEVMVRDGFPRFRFGLMVLMAILALVAVGFGAYLAGRKNGYRDGYHDGWHAAKNVVRDRL